MVDFEVFTEDVERATRKYPEELANNAGRAMELSRRKFLAEFTKERLNFAKSGPVQPPGKGLRRITGSLSRSFDGLVRNGDLDSLKLELFSAGVRYARIHEYGGEIEHPGGTRLGSGSFLSNEFIGPDRGTTKAHKIKIPARLGFRSFWDDHVDNDLMPRLEKAAAFTVKHGLDKNLRSS